MVSKHGQLRRKLLDFHLPVAQKTRRHHHQRAAIIQATVLLHLQQEGYHLERFAEAHVIGQNAAEAHFQVLVHPGIAAFLIRAKRRFQVLGQSDFGFSAPRIKLLLQTVGHVHGNVVAFARETGLNQFRRRGDKIFGFRIGFATLRVAFGILRRIRRNISGRRALLLFVFIQALLQKRQVIRRVFDVAVLILQETARILREPQEFFGRNILVAESHFPVKIQQVSRRKGANAETTLQLHLSLGARHFFKGTRHLRHDTEHFEFLDRVGHKLLEFRAMHHQRLHGAAFQISLQRLEGFGNAIQHVHQRQKSRVAIFKKRLQRFAPRRRFHQNIQRNFLAQLRAVENNLVVKFQRIVDREPSLNL